MKQKNKVVIRIPLSKQCAAVLKISESGYYRWYKNRSDPSAGELLSVEIQTILNEHSDNNNYRIERIKIALEQRGVQVSRSTVYRTMSEMGIIHRRKTSHGINRSTIETQDRKNLIKRDFIADKPLKSCCPISSKFNAVSENCMYSPC